jgi:hypothetical protein
MAGMAPASAASPLSHASGGRPPADAVALAVPASLQAAIRKSLGTAGYSRQAELTASDRAPGDQFGYSVALSGLGTTALVGAWQRHSTTGAAYVFRLRGGTWSQTAELTAPHGAPFDDFGISVALSALGTTALVGAPRHSGTGTAYVFRLRGGTWSQTAVLAASHGARGDSFGWGVALSAPGSTALVGATGRNSIAGAAYVFRLRGGTWSQAAELTAAHGAARDQFGYSVALSALGSTALGGAPYRNSAAGAAYVFRLRGGIWSQAAELTPSPTAALDQFGYSVGLSALGSTALAGAPGHKSDTGAAYVLTGRSRA